MLNVPPKREFPCFPNPGTYHVFPSSPLLWDTASVSYTPTHSDGSPNLGIYPKKYFHPVIVAGYIFCFVWRGGALDGICHLRTSQVIFVGSESISQTTIETVDVMLVLHQVPIHTDTGIGCTCLIVQIGSFVLGVCFS